MYFEKVIPLPLTSKKKTLIGTPLEIFTALIPYFKNERISIHFAFLVQTTSE